MTKREQTFKARFNSIDKWRQYETEKRRIQYEAKDADDYQRRVRELAERLGT